MYQHSSPGERKGKVFIHWTPSPLGKAVGHQLLCMPRYKGRSEGWVSSGVPQCGVTKTWVNRNLGALSEPDVRCSQVASVLQTGLCSSGWNKNEVKKIWSSTQRVWFGTHLYNSYRYTFAGFDKEGNSSELGCRLRQGYWWYLIQTA